MEERNEMKSKANISVQTIFFILMVIVFIAILFFGFQKMFESQELLSEIERIEISKKLQDAFDLCDDPLNRGSLKTVYFSNSKFDTVCVLADTLESEYENPFGVIHDVGHNVVLLELNIVGKQVIDVPSSPLIIHSFVINAEVEDTYCSANEIEIICK